MLAACVFTNFMDAENGWEGEEGKGTTGKFIEKRVLHTASPGRRVFSTFSFSLSLPGRNFN